MRVVVVTPPEALLSAAELAQLFPSTGDDGTLIAFLAKAAQAEIEPPESWVGHAFGRQTLELVLDGFPCGHRALALPYGPVGLILSVSYVDGAGSTVTLSPSEYAPTGSGLRPVSCWPAADVPGGVKIRYEAGHEASDPQLLPAKNAVALMVQAGRQMMKADPNLRRVKVDGVDETEWAVSPQIQQMMRDCAATILRRYRGVR